MQREVERKLGGKNRGRGGGSDRRGDKDRLGEGEREDAWTQLEASAGRGEKFPKAPYRPLVCQLRFQALCRVMQKVR